MRVYELINDAIDFYDLDLHGLTVYTETGSRYFVATPIIAALAGAKVYAITGDSRYGRKEEIKKFTEEFSKYCQIKEKINILFEKNPKTIYEANIITNLGFVRPIDRSFIEMMNEKAVISYMYETWEYREGDVDLASCYEKGIPVLGTNEFYPGAEVFNFSGHLCAKMLFELDIEIYKSKIVIISSDVFGTVIWRFLSSLGADAYIVSDVRSESHRQFLKNADAIVIADYHAKIPVIGDKGAQISPYELLKYSPRISIVKFVGAVNINSFENLGIPYAPYVQKGLTMGKTLGDLGPKPVIDLHTAGLKVGEIMAKARLSGKSHDETIELALSLSPAQDF